jgi:hypothetical protein
VTERRPRLARPYAVVGGRTSSSAPRLAVEALVTTTDHGLAVIPRLALERREIALLCRAPLSIAEGAAHVRLPFGVARVIVGDLAAAGVVEVHRVVGENGPGPQVLEQLLHALRAH